MDESTNRFKCIAYSGIRYWNKELARSEVLARNRYGEPVVVRCDRKAKTSAMVLGIDQKAQFFWA